MMKPFLLAGALLPAALFAQVSTGMAFQQGGWMRPASGILGATGSQHVEGQSGPVLNRPLSADEVRTTIQTLSDGSHINRTETTHFYRDSEGRMANVTETGAVIYDPVAGFTYELTTRNKTFTKKPVSADASVTIAAAAHFSSISSYSGSPSSTKGPKKAPAKQDGEQTTEELNPQSINGIVAKGSRVTVTIPANAIGNDAPLRVVNERWFSDDYKLLVKSSNSDPRFGVTTYELTNIIQAAPDPSVFQIPADYKGVN
jgi:hypothetical protein